MESWLQDCLHRAQQTLPSYRKPSYRETRPFNVKDVVHKLSVKLWNVETFGKAGKFINHPANLNLPIVPPKNNLIILIKTKRALLLIKNTPFQSTLHRDLSRKKQDAPHHESVLFHPVLKDYPTHNSWIITTQISLGNLNRQLNMFNPRKTLAHQLLMKLQDQLLASQLVLNTLLDGFSNRDNIYESYKYTIRSAVQLLKTDSENILPPENPLKQLKGTAIMREIQEIKQHANQLIQAQTKQLKTLVYVISILNITRYAAQVNRWKLNEIIDALQRSNADLNKLFNITEVLTQCIRYQQMYIYMCTILAYLIDTTLI